MNIESEIEDYKSSLGKDFTLGIEQVKYENESKIRYSEFAKPISRMYFNQKLKDIYLVNSENSKLSEYPTKWNYDCGRCGCKIDGLPFFMVKEIPNGTKSLNYKLDFIGYCSPECCKGAILETSNKEEVFELIANFMHFMREFIDPKILEISYLPKELLKKFSPFGIMDEKEWRESHLKYTGLIKQAPFAFVEQFIELKELNQSKVLKPTKEKQIQFLKQMEHIAQKKISRINSSTIFEFTN